MWVAEVIDTNCNVLQRYHLKLGQKCKVGRSADNTISFPSDKSISRLHVEFSVISATKISLTDSASRFGTSINENKLPPNQEVAIEPGTIVKFGAVNSRIHFVKYKFSFCITRLEKPDKDRLKRNAKSINAKIVQVAESATHLVCNKYTATIKLLTAIVLDLKIVTNEWLISFTEAENKPAEIIPKESDFAPASDDMCAVSD